LWVNFRIPKLNNSRKIEWVTGLYLFDEDTDVVVEADQKKGREHRDTSVDTSGYAFFGQCTYKPTDKLRLTSGLRYDYVDLEGKQLFTNNTGTKQYEKNLSNNEFLPKFSVAYDVNSNIMTYATIAKGYLHGGYNYSKATDIENFFFNEEYTWNYEIGFKSDWFDKKVTANISLFYIEMKDKQVAEWGEVTGGGGNIEMIRNAADAHSMGAELELKARPFYCLDLFAGFGFTESEIDDWVATEYNAYTGEYSSYDYKDKKLPNVPEYNYNLGIQYHHLSGLFARADLFGTGKFYSDAKNTSSEEGYEIVNLKLGFQGEHYEFFCWCKNLFDEEYNKTKFGSGDYEMGVEGDPRMLGITLAYRY
jgi:iron complex outermembrane receptor protein